MKRLAYGKIGGIAADGRGFNPRGEKIRERGLKKSK